MRIHFSFASLLVAVVILGSMFTQPTATIGQQVTVAGTTTVPVYRFYYHNPNFDGVHLYRTVPEVPGEGWQGEGIAFYIAPIQLPYAVPLYVLYKQSLGDHFYTVDKSARDYCVTNLGYTDQGIFGYVIPAGTDLPGTSSLYRYVRAWKETGYQYSHSYQDHFYMTGGGSVASYGSEGIECQVWTEAVKLPHRLLELKTPIAGTALHVNDTPMISWKVYSNGGYIRLSYSSDNGSSWNQITAIPNTGAFGVVNNQSYDSWKIPPSAAGKILIRLDWIKDPAGSKLPWATETSGPRNVVPAAIRIVRRPQ